MLTSYTTVTSPIYMFFCYFVSTNCLPVYRRPVHLCFLTTADLPFYYFVSYNCLPVYRRPAHLCPQLPPTCVPPTCLSVTLYHPHVYRRSAHLCPLTIVDLSTADLSFYYCVSVNCLPVYHRPAHLCHLTS